jgi:hypothetical protein
MTEQHFVERAYLKYNNGDHVTDEELRELHTFFQRSADLARQCPSLFGHAVISELSQKAVAFHGLLRSRDA